MSKLRFVKVVVQSIFAAFVTILLAALPSAQTFAANTNDFYFSDYQVDYYLTRDAENVSKMRVVEEFTAQFPNRDVNHGIIRTIPYTNQAGANLTTHSSAFLDMKVYRNGTTEIFSVSPESKSNEGYFSVRIGSATKYVQGEQVYRLEYEFERVITNFDDWQELYWDTNGSGWSQRFDQITARLHVEQPEVLAEMRYDSWCYVGAYGQNGQDRCQITRTDDGWEFQTENLAPAENLTFVVQFNPGTFATPIVPVPVSAEDPDTLTPDYTPIWLSIFLAALWIFVFWLFFRTGKRNRANQNYLKGLFVAPQYQPPKGLTVAEAAEFVADKNNKKGDSRVATLLELAVTGKIEIIRLSDGSNQKEQWKIRIKSLEMQTWQLAALHILKGDYAPFSLGEEFVITRHTNNYSLGKIARDFETHIQSKLKSKELTTGKKTLGGAGLLMFGIFGFMLLPIIEGTSMLMFSDAQNGQSYPVGGELISLFISFSTTLIPATSFILSFVASPGPYEDFTHDGMHVVNYMEGLKLYIQMAEAERLQFLQSVDGVDTTHEGVLKLYEKLLPYAIVFKLEKSWLNVMGEYYQYADVAAPNWYNDTSNAFTTASFIASMNAFRASTYTNFLAATPVSYSSSGSSGSGSSSSHSSSSSSGSHGGGHSGGGGGGGGGGGW